MNNKILKNTVIVIGLLFIAFCFFIQTGISSPYTLTVNENGSITSGVSSSSVKKEVTKKTVSAVEQYVAGEAEPAYTITNKTDAENEANSFPAETYKKYNHVYFVSSSKGADSNDGLSEAKPIKSLAKISKLKLQPNDLLLFKRGDTWEGYCKIEVSGTKKDAKVSIGAYGQGAKPVLRNALEIPNDELSKFSGDIYTFSNVSGWCYGVFENGKKIKHASSSKLEDGNWYYSGNKEKIAQVYYKPTDGVIGSKKVEYANEYYVIRLTSSYVDIKDLNLQYGSSGIHVKAGYHDITIENCEFSYFYEAAVTFYNTTGQCAVIGNDITKCGDGIYFVHSGDNPVGDNNTVSNNTISYSNYNKYNNNDGHAVGIQDSSNNVVENNKISYCIDAISIWGSPGNTANSNIIKHNYIENCYNEAWGKTHQGGGIKIGPEDINGTSGNKLFGNIIKGCNIGVKINKSNYPANRVYNNVIYQCNEGLKLSKGADNVLFQNNIVADSKFYHVNSEHSSNGKNNFFSNNCYYPDIENGYVSRSTKLKNFKAWKDEIKMENGSFVSYPGFVNTVEFKLDSKSPCIDAGTNDVDINVDFFGNNISGASMNDIGIHEK